MSAVKDASHRTARPVRCGSGTKGTDYVNKPYTRPEGEWLESSTKGLFRCSRCGLEQTERFDECPMCKAVMKW